MIDTLPEYDEIWEEQGDLDRLVSGPPIVPRSLFAGNAFYGGESVLTRYAGLPERYGVRAVIPHGVNLDAGFVWRSEIDAKLPAVLSFPAYRHDVYRELTNKIVIPSASPYVYALRQLDVARVSPTRKGMLYFPEHSTHHIPSSTRPYDEIEILNRLEEEFWPVTICMYWRDIDLGNHEPFAAAGFRIVTAGHIYDPQFLYRLHWLCAAHEFSSGAAFGSHIFYSILSGCKYIDVAPVRDADKFSLDGVRTKERAGKRVGRVDYSEAPDLRQILNTRTPDKLAQYEAARYFTGAPEARSREELREILEDLRQRDRRGTFVRTGNGVAYLPPGPLRRVIQAIRRFPKRVLERSRLWVRGCLARHQSA